MTTFNLTCDKCIAIKGHAEIAITPEVKVLTVGAVSWQYVYSFTLGWRDVD